MKKLLILLTSFTLLITACHQKQIETTEEKHYEENHVEFTPAQFKNAGIEFGKVEIKNISSTVIANGMLDVPPQNLVSVSALMGGFIKSTDLLQGMQVKKGQVIAVIQNPDFIQLQSEYLEKKQKLKFLELEYKRQEELSRENVASAKTFQQISSEYGSLSANVGALEEKLKILNIDPNTLTQSNIRSTANIYAPIEGYVTVVNVNIGKFVQPQDVICEIVDTKHLHAELTIFEKDISKIRKGQKIRFVLVNEGIQERTGTIFLINHKISEERTIRVHAHLDKEDPGLMPNMYLKALIEIKDNPSTTLPDEAIVNGAGKEYIFIKADKNPNEEKADIKKEKNIEFEAIEVKKGISENGYSEVILPDGFDIDKSEIVIKGTYDLLSRMNNSEEGHTH